MIVVLWRGGKRAIIALTTIMLLPFVSGSVSAATSGAVLNFEGLNKGQIIGSISSGNGIGGAVSGSVSISGSKPPMIFDSTCSGGCSGGDWDLNQPGQGQTLILSEDGDPSDPDDNAGGGTLAFNFSGLLGAVTVASVTILDAEESGGSIQAGSKTVAIPTGSNGGSQTVSINASNVTTLHINLAGSGAVDDIRITVEVDDPTPTGTPPPTDTPTPTETPTDTPTPTATPVDEGCTVEFWVANTGLWVDFAPTDDYDTTFGVGPNLTLMQAAQQTGVGENTLLRESVAGLLNASSPDVNYAFTVPEVIGLTQDAFNSGDFNIAIDQLQPANNLGCPLAGVQAKSQIQVEEEPKRLPSFYDGRLNNFDEAGPVIPFGFDDIDGRGLVIYSPFEEVLLIVQPAEIATVPECPAENTLIAANTERAVYFYRLSSCEFQINARTAEGKTYIIIFNRLYANTGYTSFEE